MISKKRAAKGRFRGFSLVSFVTAGVAWAFDGVANHRLFSKHKRWWSAKWL